ncbi:MAG: SDR family oxidoreductase [Simkaniaceae bacterium]
MDVLITGANRGIGLELVKAYLKRGDRVLALCRKASDELRALNVSLEENIDVTDLKKLKEIAKKRSNETYDLLINNAGLLIRMDWEGIDYEQIQKMIEVNTFGPLKVIQAFLPQIKENGKIAILSSIEGSMGEMKSGGRYGYRLSKAALNNAGKSLAFDLIPKKIAVALYHPGYVKTGMTEGKGDIPASESAKNLIERFDELNLDLAGSFFHANGEKLLW